MFNIIKKILIFIFVNIFRKSIEEMEDFADCGGVGLHGENIRNRNDNILIVFLGRNNGMMQSESRFMLTIGRKQSMGGSKHNFTCYLAKIPMDT